jgi:hypothetical protein
MSSDKLYDTLLDCYGVLTGSSFKENKKTPHKVLQETLDNLSEVLKNYSDYVSPDLLGENSIEGSVCPYCFTRIENGECVCPHYTRQY